MKKVRVNSWIKSFKEVWRIYMNASKSNKFIGTFLIGIVVFGSLGIWIDILKQINTSTNIWSINVQVDNFFTFIIAFISILIIDSFIEPDEIRDELKGIGILAIGLVLIITFVSYYFKSAWIVFAYFLCLLVYIAIEADKDKYDGEEDKNTLGYETIEELKDEG